MFKALLIIIFLACSVFAYAQDPVLAVDRIDKYTKERIRQTDLYTVKDASGKTQMNISVRAVDEDRTILINIPTPVNIKKGSPVSFILANGESVALLTTNEIKSASDTDVNKKLMVCSVENRNFDLLLTQSVISIKIPTLDQGVLDLRLLPADRSYLSKGLQLVK